MGAIEQLAGLGLELGGDPHVPTGGPGGVPHRCLLVRGGCGRGAPSPSPEDGPAPAVHALRGQIAGRCTTRELRQPPH
jgi:hypothetical protein